MAKSPTEDRRLARLSKISLALPEATRTVCRQHAGFLVRKKTFAWFLNDHHSDGIMAVTCKVLPGDNKALAAAQPDRFYIPAYVGSRGWVALRLDVGEVDWDEVAELVFGSYRKAAPGDRDAQPLTEADLKRMKRTPQARIIRRALKLTQEEFAVRYTSRWALWGTDSGE